MKFQLHQKILRKKPEDSLISVKICLVDSSANPDQFGWKLAWLAVLFCIINRVSKMASPLPFQFFLLNIWQSGWCDWLMGIPGHKSTLKDLGKTLILLVLFMVTLLFPTGVCRKNFHPKRRNKLFGSKVQSQHTKRIWRNCIIPQYPNYA